MIQPTPDNTTNLNQNLSGITGSLPDFLPEIFLGVFILFLILIDLFPFRHKAKANFIISLVGFLTLIFLLGFQWQSMDGSQAKTLFLDMLILDKLAVFLKLLFAGSGVVTLLLSFNYDRKNRLPGQFGEYYTLIFGLVLGAMLLSMSVNLLMIYISIELISISSYILTNFSFGKKSAEAGIKYLLFGAVASGVMLYGMSLLYGFTGTLAIGSMEFATNLDQIPRWPYFVAVFLTIAGFIFKLGAVPFHIWAPDIYEGAPTPIAALFSTVPKIAGGIILVRFLMSLPQEMQVQVDTLDILAIVAVVTMLVGNLSALWQENAKRMMAYSSIAHAGFMLCGIVAYSRFGLSSFLFYATIFSIMNFAAFLLIKILNDHQGKENLRDFAGWGKEYPLIGVMAVIIMISLTGIPPTAGFTAKLLIFSAVWEAYQTNNDPILLTLFAVGLLNTVLALFYYIKIPYYMFFRSSVNENSVNLQKEENKYSIEKFLLGLLTLPLLVLFFKSGWLSDIIRIVTFEF